LIGIILLVVELSQNRDMIRAQTRNEISQQLSNRLLSVATNSQLASVIRRARDDEKLTEDEFTQIYLYQIANLRDWENIHYQYRHGTFDEQEFDAEKTAWRSVIEDNKTFQGVFCYTRSNYSPEFVAELESVLHEDYCATPQRD
jgi:DNA-binding transcriptional regulator YiaG